MGSTEWLEVMWGPGPGVRQWEEVGAFKPHVPHSQGYLSVLHLKAVVYVSLDNAVLGKWGRCPPLGAPWCPLATGAPALSLASLLLPLCRRRQVPCQDQPSSDQPHREHPEAGKSLARSRG